MSMVNKVSPNRNTHKGRRCTDWWVGSCSQRLAAHSVPPWALAEYLLTPVRLNYLE